MRFKDYYTHYCEKLATYIAPNAFLFQRNRWTEVLLPRVIYTNPEIAIVGKYSIELDQQNVKYDTWIKFYEKLDRAICDGTKGMLKIITCIKNNTILWACAVGGPAGEMISTLTAAIHNKLTLD